MDGGVGTKGGIDPEESEEVREQAARVGTKVVEEVDPDSIAGKAVGVVAQEMVIPADAEVASECDVIGKPAGQLPLDHGTEVRSPFDPVAASTEPVRVRPLDRVAEDRDDARVRESRGDRVRRAARLEVDGRDVTHGLLGRDARKERIVLRAGGDPVPRHPPRHRHLPIRHREAGDEVVGRLRVGDEYPGVRAEVLVQRCCPRSAGADDEEGRAAHKSGSGADARLRPRRRGARISRVRITHSSVRERTDPTPLGVITGQQMNSAREWRDVAVGTRGVRSPLWRAYCDGLNKDLVAPWLRHVRAGLKTDLFDEAVGWGLVGALMTGWDEVHGIDVAESVVRAACSRHPALRGVVADVRALPYPTASFDAVVSNSTLDHFDDPEDIDRALAEFARVLVPGGRLLITLDNLANPVVWLRSAVSPRLLRRLRLTPFPVGRTLTRPGLVAAVERAGLIVEGSGLLMHAPRVPAVWACDLAGRSSGGGHLLLPLLRSTECLGRLRTRDRTGYYAVVYASRAGG